MSRIDLEINGYTLIPPEILEQMTQQCQLETLTIGCMRKQLDLPAAYLIVVNGLQITDLTFEITLEDEVGVVPMVAGG